MEEGEKKSEKEQFSWCEFRLTQPLLSQSCKHTHMCTHAHTRTHTRTNIYAHVHTHTHTHTNTHTHNAFTQEQDIQKSSLVRRTEQLPRAIEGFPTGKRDNIIHEIYQSEYTYVAGLEVLIDVRLADTKGRHVGEMSSVGTVTNECCVETCSAGDVSDKTLWAKQLSGA